MASRSLNKVMLIGNLTRDPELRYTPTGAAVCTIGLATNRYWTTESGEKKEEVEFHRVVAWNKLAELCSQLLVKGRKIYVEGRLRTNSWKATDGTQRSTTEVVIEDMIILDSRLPAQAGKAGVAGAGEDGAGTTYAQPAPTAGKQTKKDEHEEKHESSGATETVNPDDIPF
ncbi:single-stranded DNA-binding protein [Candidatus Gottesmanbacteria bacterium]|nr:single-stranded DNA-binding protein [Candidatus Gottesmanbacteria bacterium]